MQVIKDYKEMTRGEKMNLVDAIDNRVSVRTYQNKQISNDDIIKIKTLSKLSSFIWYILNKK